MADDRIQLILEAQDKISATLAEIEGKLNGVQKSTKGLSDTFKKYLTGAAIAKAFKFIIDQAAESEKAINDLKFAVDASGGSWKKLEAPMKAYATLLADTSTFTDEEVMGVMKKLVSVTGDSTQSWKMAKLAIDIAAGGSVDLEQATKILTMTVSGNTEAAGRMVKQLTGLNLKLLEGKTNAEKTQIIFGALNNRFSGKAQKDLETYAGQIATLKKNIGELAENIGGWLIPVLVQSAEGWNKFFTILRGEPLKTTTQKTMELSQATADAKIAAIQLASEHKKTADEIFKEQEKIKKKIESVNKDILADVENKFAAMKSEKDISLQEEIDYWDNVIATAKIKGEGLVNIQTDQLNRIGKRREGFQKDFIDSFTNGYDAIGAITNTWANQVAGYISNAFSGTGIDKLLGGIGLSAGGIFGGVAGFIVSGFTSLFGQQKSFAQMVEDAYGSMVEKTNKKINEIGRQKTEAEKRLELLETLKPEEGEEGKYLKGDTAAYLRVSEKTYAQAQTYLLEQLLKTQQQQLEFSKTNLQDLKKQRTTDAESLKKLQELYIELTTAPQSVTSVLAKINDPNIMVSIGGKMDKLQSSIEAADKYIAELEAGKTIDELDILREIAETKKELGLPFASGGIVTHPTRAIIGEKEPEAVIPLSKLGNMGGANITISSGAFVLNGINWTNEDQRKKIAKDLASYITSYTSGMTTTPRGAERFV